MSCEGCQSCFIRLLPRGFIFQVKSRSVPLGMPSTFMTLTQVGGLIEDTVTPHSCYGHAYFHAVLAQREKDGHASPLSTTLHVKLIRVGKSWVMKQLVNLLRAHFPFRLLTFNPDGREGLHPSSRRLALGYALRPVAQYPSPHIWSPCC